MFRWSFLEGGAALIQANNSDELQQAGTSKEEFYPHQGEGVAHIYPWHHTLFCHATCVEIMGLKWQLEQSQDNQGPHPFRHWETPEKERKESECSGKCQMLYQSFDQSWKEIKQYVLGISLMVNEGTIFCQWDSSFAGLRILHPPHNLLPILGDPNH